MKYIDKFFRRVGFRGHDQRLIDALLKEEPAGVYDYVGNGIRIRFDLLGNYLLYKSVDGRGVLMPVSIVVEEQTTYVEIHGLKWGDGSLVDGGSLETMKHDLIMYFREVSKSGLCFLKEGDGFEESSLGGHRKFMLPSDVRRRSSRQL